MQQESIHEPLKLLPEEVFFHFFFFQKSEAFNLKGAAVFIGYFTCVLTASLIYLGFFSFFCPDRQIYFSLFLRGGSQQWQ